MDHAAAAPDPSFISSRTVGEAQVTVVSDGTILWAPRFPVAEDLQRQAMPDADAEGRVILGLNVVLIALGDSRIVVDPALDDPGTAFERSFAAQLAASGSPIEINRSPGFAAALDVLGWAPDEVTDVVITHPHGDHYGGVTVERDGKLQIRFPNARHFVGRADWDGNPALADPASDLALRLGAIDRRGLLELVTGEREIVPGVTLLPAPGESPGHQVMCLQSAGETLYVAGDLVHHACEVANPTWAPRHADAATLAATRTRFFAEMARSGALVIGAHEPFPAWRRVTTSDQGFGWEAA